MDKYYVKIPVDFGFEAQCWCFENIENCPKNGCLDDMDLVHNMEIYAFDNIEDATAFKLKWS